MYISSTKQFTCSKKTLQNLTPKTIIIFFLKRANLTDCSFATCTSCKEGSFAAIWKSYSSLQERYKITSYSIEQSLLKMND